MKKLLFISSILLCALTLGAQDISGIWYAPIKKTDNATVVEIFEENGKYFAYGFAEKDGGKQIGTDVKNPNSAMRDKSLTGLLFVYDVTFDGNAYTKGKMYNPENGKTFFLKIKRDGADKLILRASVDAAGVFGATFEWTRAETPNSYTPLPKSELRLP